MKHQLTSTISKLISKKPFHAHNILQKHYPRIWKYIIKHTKDGEKDRISTETLYRFITNTTRPLCPTCNSYCPFLSFNKGYQQHCSNRCAQLDETTRNKIMTTCMNKYGTPHTAIHNRSQSSKTMLEKYGVKYYTLASDFKLKSKQTNIKKRGVEHHMQDAISFRNSQYSQFRIKQYTTSSGKIFNYQGYEHVMIEWLLANNIDECEIETDLKSIPYVWNNKKRRYFPDIYVSKYNLMIEVKSPYYFERDKQLNFRKQRATLEKGYNHIIVVITSNYTFEQVIGSIPSDFPQLNVQLHTQSR